MKSPTDHQKKKYSRYLSSGEHLIAAFGIGDRYFWYNIVPMFILSIPLVGMPWMLKLLHQKHSLTYLLTNRRVILKEGIFTTEVTTAPYHHITHIIVKENFLHKISFQVGDIVIHTAGPTPIEMHLHHVQDPLTVKNLIEELMIKERTLPGLEETKRPLVKSF